MLLALKMEEEEEEPRNVGGFWNLECSRNRFFPIVTIKAYSPTGTLILGHETNFKLPTSRTIR